jgi:hypothetical protein
MKSSRLGPAAAIALSISGCFHSASGTDAGPGVDTATCSTLASSGILVQPGDANTASAPAATGGTLIAGTYHLTSTVYYPAATCVPTQSGTDLRVTLTSAASGTIETVTVTAAGDVIGEVTRFVAAGTELTLSLVCVSPAAASGVNHTGAVFPYSVDGSGNLSLTNADPNCGTSVSTYVFDGA